MNKVTVLRGEFSIHLPLNDMTWRYPVIQLVDLVLGNFYERLSAISLGLHQQTEFAQLLWRWLSCLVTHTHSSSQVITVFVQARPLVFVLGCECPPWSFPDFPLTPGLWFWLIHSFGLVFMIIWCCQLPSILVFRVRWFWSDDHENQNQ